MEREIDNKKMWESILRQMPQPNNFIESTIVSDEIIKNALKEQGFEFDGENIVPISQKPKFKEGDWIVQGCNILKIRCVGNEYYCYETVGGYKDDMLVSEIDSLYHLWTIDDAKDGDILQLGGVTAIFKDYLRNGNCKCYCSSYEEEFEVPVENESYGTINSRPATEEQRELLFSKMKEAGYMWDTEKKELKKIEQNPVNKFKVTIVQNVKDDKKSEISLIKDILFSFKNGRIYNVSAEDFGNCLAWLEKQGEQKQEWSEEDEEMFLDIESLIHSYRVGSYEHELSSWVKSLKDRCLPQSKQEWSEEDKHNLMKKCVHKAYHRGYERGYNTGVQDIIHKGWKPTEEHIKALEFTIDGFNEAFKSVGYMDNYTKRCLREILKQLKAL